MNTHRQRREAETVAYLESIESRTKSAGPVVGGLRYALQSGNPGGWASDHREESSRFTGWHYIAIRTIALQYMQAQVSCFAGPAPSSKSRLKNYAEQSDDSEPLDSEHPLSRILKRPNPAQSGASFRYEIAVQLNLTGTCLMWNVPNRLGKTVERYVVPTCIAQPMQPNPQYPRGFWRITPEGSRWGPEDGWFLMGGLVSMIGAGIPAEQMQVIRWPHPIYRDDGQSPVAAGALWSDTAAMVDRSRWAHMKNGPNPSAIVQMPDDWDGDEADLERGSTKFDQKYSGPEKHGRAIFTTGSKVTLVGNNPQEMAYHEAFLQLRDAALAIHGVPGIAAGITDGGSYAAFYAALLQLTKLTTQPQLAFVAEEETERLAPQFGDKLTVEMLAPPIDDATMLEQQLRTDLSAGIRKRDEYRTLRGLKPLGGALGEELVKAGGSSGSGASGASGTPEVVGAAASASESSTGLPGMPALPALPGGSMEVPGAPAVGKNRIAHLNGHANGKTLGYP